MAGLSHSRTGTTPDTGRMGEALARPGMDPRINVARARIVAVNVDPDHGVICTVALYPHEDEHSAEVGPIYAGNGWGIYLPLHVDDEVIVGVTDGNPSAGLTVICRTWSAADKPPTEAKDHPADLIVHVEKDSSLRLIVEGDGDALINATDGNVKITTTNGSVDVEAGKQIALTAGTLKVTLDKDASSITIDASGKDLKMLAKKITMTADDIEAIVTNAMDVHH